MTTEPTRPPADQQGGGTRPHRAAAEVIRAEEQLRLGTVSRVRERVAVRKRVVTEEVSRTVAVAREVLEIDRTPADPSEQPTPVGKALPEPVEIDIVLHEERVVVTTEVVPVERVRVRVHRLTEQVEVTEVLRRERVEVDPVAPTAAP